jgi:thioredoxin-like negative regulator of GroEL
MPQPESPLSLPNAKKSSWPDMTATVASTSENITLVLREIVKNSGWRVSNNTGYLDAALGELQHGYASLLIIDESPDLTGPEAVHTLISHPVGRLTPCLVILAEFSRMEAMYYKSVLGVMPVVKPLTPSKFLPAFDDLKRQWENPIFTIARKCAAAMTKGDFESVKPVLLKMTTVPTIEVYAATALSQIYLSEHKFKDAETILLQTFKRSPKSMGLLLSLARFYISAQMPHNALRFLERLKTSCNGTTLFAFDIALTALTLGKVDMALEHLTEWHRQHPGCQHVVQNIAKLLVAEGRAEDLEELLELNKALSKRIVDRWDKLEAIQQPA